MAAVTSITKVVNKTSNDICIELGDGSQRYTINESDSWIGSIWIPWCGAYDQYNKVVRLYYMDFLKPIIFDIYQDYDKGSIKYSKKSPFYYSSSENSKVPGSSGTGGNRLLTVQSVGRD
ncbi:MAG: hypothetical protein NBV76_09940 [Candidatus Ochrobactrum gambitense]|nr:MAG: hypothetical protein NBV76_09940 [Candidatus Ochrobactrum gambitense]WEK16361.1 MAG: hypothetical protein P0Y54_01025 [Candidatus Ochrobactrum gambitense]